MWTEYPRSKYNGYVQCRPSYVADYPLEASLPAITRPAVDAFSSCLPLPTPINHVVLLPNVKKSNNIILVQPGPSKTSAPTVPSCTSTPEPTSRCPFSVSEQSSSTEATSESVEDADIVAWMKENFKSDPVSLLSREHVYDSYKKFAKDKGKTIMNPACLGKAMRKVFPGMKTRRLGKRGDSKYHYGGIDTLSKGNRNASAVRLPLQRKRRPSPNSPSTAKPKTMLASAAVAEVPVTSTSYMVPPRKKRKIKSSVILDKDIVKWLQRNFRNNAVSVIPRHFVFNKYKEYCEKINKTDTNAACFGKTLRGVFPNMETRRLGSRGSSKYHYAGIEVHPNGDYEDSHPFFKVARRQKFRSTSVSSTDAPSTVSSLPTEPSSDPVSLIEPFPKTSTGPNEDQLHALNVVEVLQKFIDIIPVTGSTSCICPSIRQRLTWTDTLLSVKASKSISGDDLDCFLVHLRVHIAMLARCVLSGAILGMPDIVGNFWVSRKKR
ncbi:hypothetical protein RvY_03589-4 [Ramazzottius varieornatus]|uniref:RFX-type winged-helix domain-containing protein n=1 Tax=Ramazzottius varieornatus TaxID=947166 RepID=A0A1D1URZ5_RAMVA|nr:hypothetical protein RvY_03589-4 [Ramazzottius varieornatus]